MFLESVILWLHILLFVYWLGGDLGVFYSSRFRNSPKYDIKTRQLIAKITSNIDMAPKTTMVLMIPIGFSLVAINNLWIFPNWIIIFFWIFGIAWLILVWFLHLTKNAEKKAPWTKFDLILRYCLCSVLVIISVTSFFNNYPLLENWLALKVLLFALTIFCGIMIRISAKPYILAFGKMTLEGSSPEIEKVITESAAKARRWVKAIWFLISIAAFIGIWKPII
ncbi:MAG: hypothetical protein CFH01_00241 [Alphaproteobacteria bacterium MarineAlpha2_Bin1]|nr:MAG: hypothetical protein CFH01_00241 [Alphaproteobacteria bacterium MarineAlpha2_Bin1]|tara:strand:- start:1184 stop:1852 length:669 start_codon:yes stop_codon:yes gene_type:complete